MIIGTNPNKNIVKKVRQQLKENFGYCPNKSVNLPETRCICKKFMEQNFNGYCECGLFYKDLEKEMENK